METVKSRAKASGGKSASGGIDVRSLLEREIGKLQLRFRASGYKSSEGDGRTAADIERELAARRLEE